MTMRVCFSNRAISSDFFSISKIPPQNVQPVLQVSDLRRQSIYFIYHYSSAFMNIQYNTNEFSNLSLRPAVEAGWQSDEVVASRSRERSVAGSEAIYIGLLRHSIPRKDG